MLTDAGQLVTKHPDFSIAQYDKHLWLRAENVLFCVHQSILNSQSPLFKDLLSLPPPPGQCQGSVEEMPVILPNIKADNLALLLGIVYWSYERDKRQFTVEELLDVLELASMLLVRDCRSKALDLLAGHNIPAAKQLQVAMDCQIPDWVEPSFRRLVDNFEHITLADAVLLGHTLFYQVSMTRHLMTQCRQAVVAFVSEFKVNSSCDTKDACRAAFRQVMDSGFARLYNNPDTPLRAEDALPWLEQHLRQAICIWCWSRKWASLRFEDVGDVKVFELEAKVFADAVRDLQARMAPFPIE